MNMIEFLREYVIGGRSEHSVLVDLAMKPVGAKFVGLSGPVIEHWVKLQSQ
jgi:hypothetical protein